MNTPPPIVVGGTTVRNEGYEGLLGDEAKARREARGLPPEPELVVFTRASPSPPDLWRELRARYPDQLIVCEGGPTVLGLIVEHGLLDQLVLCVSPRIVGGDSEKRLIEHARVRSTDSELELQGVADTSEGFIVRSRYRTRSDPSGPRNAWCSCDSLQPRWTCARASRC